MLTVLGAVSALRLV